MVKESSNREYSTLCNLLYAYRIQAGLKQVEVAKKIGMPQSHISKIENGERKIDLVELSRLCEVYNITLSEFVEKFQKKVNEGK